MNHLFLGLALVITMSAEKCNENRNDQGTGGASTPPPSAEIPETTGGTQEQKGMVTQDGPEGQRWYFVSINGTEITLPEGAERPWLELNAGQLQGFTGCNNMMGGYALEKDRLSFTEVGSTKKYCPDVQATERAIMDALATVSNYSITGGDLMLMKGRGEAALLRIME